MKRRHWVALVVVLTAVGAIELYIWQSRRPAGHEPGMAVSAERKSPPQLEPGDRVPSFEAENLRGGVMRVEYPADGRTFVVFLSPTCSICKKTLPQWERLAREVEGRAQVYSVMVGGEYESDQIFLTSHQPSFPLLRMRDPETRRRYKPARVPQTILVGPEGWVEEVIIGALSDSQVDELVLRAKRPVGDPS